MLGDVLQSPGKLIGQLQYLSDQDMEQICTWNDNVPSAVDDCIHDAFARQVLAQPDAPALHSTDSRFNLSYRELDIVTNSIAQSLVAAGVGPESLVPFCFSKSPLGSISMLAILKAGGACVALDPSQPVERLRLIIKDSGANVVVVAEEHAHMFLGSVKDVILINPACISDSLAMGDIGSPNRQSRPETPAFVIFTSGSTGTPKGIIVEHRAFCTSARVHAPKLHMSADSRVLQFAAYTYDLSIAETFTTLMVGACICVPSENERLDSLAQTINALQVTWMFLTPTMVSMLRPEEVPGVKTLILGGEHATHSNFASWSTKVCLINSYGPAECSIWTNALIGVKPTTNPANIGSRFGVSCWVADPLDHNILCPIGAPGELIIGGSVLARGYLNDPIKTGEAFLINTAWTNKRISSNGSTRFYKSGDLVRYNTDGTLSFVGRKDTQIKLHGHRIELEDIEKNLARDATLNHTLMILPKTGILEKRLTAVLAFRDMVFSKSSTNVIELLESSDGNSVTEHLAHTRTNLEQWLPKHMIPAVWIVVKCIPLLTSGKLNRRAVMSWVENMDEQIYSNIMSLAAEGSIVKPKNDLERDMQHLWAYILKIPIKRIGVEQTFLSLGGDSISAMQLASRSRSKGMNIFVQDVLRLKSISKLAEHVAGKSCPDVGFVKAKRFGLLPVKGEALEDLLNATASRFGLTDLNVIEDLYPCSPMQEGLLLSQAKQHDLYKVRSVWKVMPPVGHKSINVENLKQAWVALISRHQVLRTYFVESGFENANFLQVCLRKVEEPVHIIQLSGLDDLQNDLSADIYTEEELPYRVTICETPEGVYVKLTINHAIEDGSSTQNLLRDLSRLYSGLPFSDDAPLYSDYISFIQRSSMENAVNYWKNYLADAEPCIFPVLNSTLPVVELQTIYRKLDGKAVSKILHLCSLHELTLAGIFKFVWALVLRAYIGTDSVCFGEITSGRDAPISNVQDIVGPLINMLICRLKINPSKTALQSIKKIQDDFVQSLTHQQCPLSEISHVLRADSSEPFFNTIVNVQRIASAYLLENDNGLISFQGESIYDPTEVSPLLQILL